MHRVLLPLLAACGPSVGSGDGVMDDSEVPQPGWVAEFTTHQHDVAGRAEILDASTIELQDFTFDGQGINARLFLAVDGATFTEDYELSDNLVGEAIDSETFEVQIPDQAELETWNLITLWCVPAAVSFGDGVFQPPE